MSDKPSKFRKFVNSLEEYSDENRIISYNSMRRNIGIFGMSLPFVLIIGSVLFFNYNEIQVSVSQYYHTGMRDVFVGIIFFVALFLFAYRGYNILDRIAGIIAGTAALGIALFPAAIVKPGNWIDTVHIISASVFFITLALISIFLFTLTEYDKPKEKSDEKKNRNKLYRVCGIIMLGCMLLILLWFRIDETYPELIKYKPVFCLETIALIAFGISWLAKGGWIWKDKVKVN